MKLEQSFDVAALLERVWQALIDVERVAPCLPGAAVTGRNEDGSYNGKFSVKIGPTSASDTGKLEMEKIDEATHTAMMQAHGTDRRGQGGAKATIMSTVSATDEGGTRVELVTDYHITGRLARFGRGGMIEDISERLLRTFADCLQATVGEAPESGNGSEQAPAPSDGAASAPSEAGPPVGAPPGSSEPLTTVSAAPASSEPIEGISFMSSVLWGRARRNPAGSPRRSWPADRAGHRAPREALRAAHVQRRWSRARAIP